jgi:hypothetical protein
MSISVLTQTYDEVRRLAIAGSIVAPGDFRLKKLLPQLEAAGKKAPVFARVAEAVTRLLDSSEKTSAAPLLELAALVNAILYTQGETGVEGELTPLETIELRPPKTQASARMLKPLLEALTTTGSGRLEIIRDAFERGAFHDLRLIAPTLKALDDTYSEIGDLVADKILPLYGRAILPELQATFDPKGRTGHVRRLVLMHRLDPQATRPTVQRALDEGTQEVRIAAIGCLGDSPADLPFLLEQSKAKAKDVRGAALKALGSSSSGDAAKVLCDALEGTDLTLAVEPLRTSQNARVTAFLIEAAQTQWAAVLAGKERDKKKLGRQNERMVLILECLRGRDDQRSAALVLTMFEQAERLAGVKGEPSGKDVFERLVSVMADGPPPVQSALVEAHASLPAECVGLSFLSACRARPPAEVFDLFSPYLTAGVNEKKKGRDPAWAKREAIIELLVRGGARRHVAGYDSGLHEIEAAADLDPRWLDVAVKLERVDLVQGLAVPGHAGANALLSRVFHERLARPKDDYGLIGILGAMIHVSHPEATEAAVALIERSAKARAYGDYWVGYLIPKLPPAAIPRLEAILPTLPERWMDELLNAVTVLKHSSADHAK